MLSAIIKEHLRTGEPVASRSISERFAGGAGWSSATIRNVMAELEEHGLVEQPHTSAGRVPTDKGYRFYVDHFVGDARLSRADISAIDRALGLTGDAGAQAPTRLMERVSHVLSELSENVGIVVSPPVADSRLEHIEFLPLADGRILVVLVLASNVVQNKIIRIDEPLTADELESAARYLNVEFSGKTLQTIRAEVLALMGEEKALYDRLLRNAVLLFERGVEGGGGDETGDVYIDGASNILAKPDFSDVERLRELFRTFEAKSRLVKILNECIAREPVFGDVHVVIGREHTRAAAAARARSSPRRTAWARASSRARSASSARCGWSTRGRWRRSTTSRASSSACCARRRAPNVRAAGVSVSGEGLQEG